MGWKAIRDHYRIGHIVQVSEGKILIGSGYVHELLIIGADGNVAWGELGKSSNDELARYKREMDADPAKLRELLAAPDVFSVSTTVYAYDGAEIIEAQCEIVGWPNCTHDGKVMYDNTHFVEKSDAIACAKRNAKAGVAWTSSSVADAETQLAKVRGYRDDYVAMVAKLDTDYPIVPTRDASDL